MLNGDKMLPFVRFFNGSPSTFLWEDEMGAVTFVPQGEGGEQGVPLMPLLFSLGQHRGLSAVAETSGPREHLVGFLDDVYVATNSPARTVDAHNILGEEMWRHAKITLHHRKTVIWNKRGRAPEGVEVLEEDLSVVVWRGNPDLADDGQGVVVLGTPFGHAEFVSRVLDRNTASSWRGFQQCKTAHTETFAQEHDRGICRCLCQLLHVDPDSVTPSEAAAASLPLPLEALGPRSARSLRGAAQWARWASRWCSTAIPMLPGGL